MNRACSDRKRGMPDGLAKIIRVELPDELYTRVHPAIVRDPELSLAARGLLLTLIGLGAQPADNSEPGGTFDISQNELVASIPDGLTAFRTAKNLLKRLGYLRCTKHRLRGRYLWLWQIFETRQMFREYRQSGLFTELDRSMAPAAKPIEQPTPLFDQLDDAVTPPGHESDTWEDRSKRQVMNSTGGEPIDGQSTGGERAPYGSYGAAHHGRAPFGGHHGRDEALSEIHTDRAASKRPSRPRSRSGGKRNIVGGPCIANIDDASILQDTRALLFCYRENHGRGAFDEGTDRHGNRIEGVTPRQFIAAAVRAEQVAARQGGNALAIFAKLVNVRGTPKDAKDGGAWKLITESQWDEAKRRMDRQRRKHDLWKQVHAIHEAAQRAGVDPLHAARHSEYFPDDLTREAWDQAVQECGYLGVVGSTAAP